MGCINSVDTSNAPDEPPRGSKSRSEHRHFRSQLIRDNACRWEDRYEKETELGHGMTGKVYRVKDRITGDRYALKCLEADKFDADLIGDLINEIELLKTVSNPTKLVGTSRLVSISPLLLVPSS